jgi:hypothetical protein
VKSPLISCAGFLLVVAGAASADEAPSSRKTPQVVPLQVQAVLMTRMGDKKLSNVPYSFTCLAADEPSAGARSSIRLGTELPIPVTTVPSAAATDSTSSSTSFQYRNVGTVIECTGTLLTDGRFSLHLRFEQGSVEGMSKAGTVEVPIFKTRVADLRTIFRDGQTIHVFAGADPSTGEVSSLDVTVTVLK